MSWWVVQNFAVAVLLAAVVWSVCRAGRVRPATAHALWVVVLIKLLTPPLLVVESPWTLPAGFAAPERVSLDRASVALVPPPARSIELGRIGERELTVEPPRSMAKAPTAPVRGRSRPAPPVVRARDLIAIGQIVWLAGALLFLGIQAVRILRIARAVRRARPAGGELAADVDRLATLIGIAPVPIRVVSGIATPFVWCLHPRRPELLWPAELSALASTAQHRGLILHELAHVKRHDHWIGWIELAAGTLWWWNPLFWYVRSQVRENAELACDAWVVNTLPQERRAYAEALVAACEARTSVLAPLPAMGVASGHRRSLERRLVVIMRHRVPLRVSRIGALGVALCILLTLPAWALRATTTPREVAPIPASRITLGPIAAPHVAGAQPPAPQPELQRLIDDFNAQEAQVRQQTQALAQNREVLIARLESMQKMYADAGLAENAAAVRRQLERLRVASAGEPIALMRSFQDAAGRYDLWLDGIRVQAREFKSERVMGGGLGRLRRRIGESFNVPVVGALEGTVWGSNVYTDDSSISTAAVHAGLVAPGEFGFVRLTIAPGQDSYEGSSSYGVSSQSYGPWEGSFRLDPAPQPWVFRQADGDVAGLFSLSTLRGHEGASFTMEITGSSRGGSVWGSDIYTDDSSIAAAAVHAGILRDGERGFVRVTVGPGMNSYAGSERNGVRSDSYDEWEGSFRLERGVAPR